MADTVVLITIHSGPNVPASPTYVMWEAALRLVDGVAVVVPAPGAVRLDSTGNGSVSVPAGIWYVTEIVPGSAAQRRAVVVPESSEPVQYATLQEVTNPAEIGFGPTWEQIVLNYATLAKESADDAAAYLQSIQDLVEGFDAGQVVRSVNGQAPDPDGNVVITVSGTIVVASISDASDIGKDLLKATDGAAVRSLIGAGTGDGTGPSTPSNLDYRMQNADGTWPLAGSAPASQLLLWIPVVAGTNPPPTTGEFARFPSLYLKVV